MGIVAVFFIKPIAQNLNFHHFADDREILSVPNFWNVTSNLPFLIIGSIGVFYTLSRKAKSVAVELRSPHFIFFLGIFFTAIGSSYYHLDPNNKTLVWDRLPMTISFMSFFAIIIGEYINIKIGNLLMWPLLGIGIISVFYWNYTEGQGQGELRIYMLVQFLPMLLIPLIVLLFDSRSASSKHIWLMLLAYAIAKVFEATDHSIYSCGHLISGHTIKHFFAALAPLILIARILKSRHIP